MVFIEESKTITFIIFSMSDIVLGILYTSTPYSLQQSSKVGGYYFYFTN